MKFYKFSVAVIATVALLFATADASATNLLVDPGFENGPFIDDGSGVGKWQPFGGAGVGLPTLSAIDGTMPLSGASNAHLTLDNIANSFAGFFQDVSVVPGDAVTASIWHKSIGADTDGTEFRVEWHDGSGEITRDQITPVPTDTYTQISLDNVIAPAGAITARFVYASQSFGGGPNQDLLLDDASLVIIPEPTSLALMGLAGVAAATMRRRK